MGTALPAASSYKYIFRTFCTGLLSAAELAFLPLLFLVWLTTRLICLPPLFTRKAGSVWKLRSHLAKKGSDVRTEPVTWDQDV